MSPRMMRPVPASRCISTAMPDTSSPSRLVRNRGDTSDTAFCGNWFPREESIDNRGSQRLHGNRLVSGSYERSSVNSETWRTTEASLQIPPPRPAMSILERFGVAVQVGNIVDPRHLEHIAFVLSDAVPAPAPGAAASSSGANGVHLLHTVINLLNFSSKRRRYHRRLE